VKNYFNQKKNLWLLLVVLSLVFFGFYFLDQFFSTFLTEDQNNKIYRPIRTLTDLGEALHFFIFAIGIWIFSVWALRAKKSWNFLNTEKIESLRRWSSSLFYSLLVSGLIVHLLKFVFGRLRPHRSLERDPFQFDPFNFHHYNHSFPSGHAQTLFVVATALSMAQPKWQAWFYGSAIILSLTRVVLHAHFFSDVVFGAYLGFIVTVLIYKAYRNTLK